MVQSDEPHKWEEAISKAKEKSRDVRLQEAIDLRTRYDEKYKWKEQCEAIVEKLRQRK